MSDRSEDGFEDFRALLARQIAEGRLTCEWFLMCENPATHVAVHPAFPTGVPSCDRCANIGR